MQKQALLFTLLLPFPVIHAMEPARQPDLPDQHNDNSQNNGYDEKDDNSQLQSLAQEVKNIIERTDFPSYCAQRFNECLSREQNEHDLRTGLIEIVQDVESSNSREHTWESKIRHLQLMKQTYANAHEYQKIANLAVIEQISQYLRNRTINISQAQDAITKANFTGKLLMEALENMCYDSRQGSLDRYLKQNAPMMSLLLQQASVIAQEENAQPE